MFKKNLCFILFVLFSFSLFAGDSTTDYIAGASDDKVEQMAPLYFNSTTKEMDLLYIQNGRLYYTNRKAGSQYMRNCYELWKEKDGSSDSFIQGTYPIDPDGDGNPTDVYCDEDGWTLLVKIGNNRTHINAGKVGDDITSNSGIGKFSDVFINQVGETLGSDGIMKLRCHGQNFGYAKYDQLKPFTSIAYEQRNYDIKFDLQNAWTSFSNSSSNTNHIVPEIYGTNHMIYAHLGSASGCYYQGSGINSWGGSGDLWLGKDTSN